MNTFSQIGENMLLAHQGQQELARLGAAWLSRRTSLIAAWLRTVLGKVPPSEVHSS